MEEDADLDLARTKITVHLYCWISVSFHRKGCFGLLTVP